MDTWTTPEGKEIPYQREIIQFIDGEEEGIYQIAITKWPKNTSLDIIHLVDFNGDPLDPLIEETMYRLAKFPHHIFAQQKSDLISKAEKWIKKRLPHLY